MSKYLRPQTVVAGVLIILSSLILCNDVCAQPRVPNARDLNRMLTPYYTVKGQLSRLGLLYPAPTFELIDRYGTQSNFVLQNIPDIGFWFDFNLLDKYLQPYASYKVNREMNMSLVIGEARDDYLFNMSNHFVYELADSEPYFAVKESRRIYLCTAKNLERVDLDDSKMELHFQTEGREYISSTLKDGTVYNWDKSTDLDWVIEVDFTHRMVSYTVSNPGLVKFDKELFPFGSGTFAMVGKSP